MKAKDLLKLTHPSNATVVRWTDGKKRAVVRCRDIDTLEGLDYGTITWGRLDRKTNDFIPVEMFGEAVILNLSDDPEAVEKAKREERNLKARNRRAAKKAEAQGAEFTPEMPDVMRVELPGDEDLMNRFPTAKQVKDAIGMFLHTEGYQIPEITKRIVELYPRTAVGEGFEDLTGPAQKRIAANIKKI